MNLVALEASTRAASVAVRSQGRVIARSLAAERAHASDLVPALAELLDEAGLVPREVEGIVVGTGPGSFTGLRVAVSTALGLARGSGALLYGVPSHAAAAWQSLAGRADAPEATIVQDARAGSVQVSRWQLDEGELHARLDPRLVPCGEARAFLEDASLLFADAAALEASGLEPDDARVAGAPDPTAEALLALQPCWAAQHGPTPAQALRPLYLKAFIPAQRRR